MKSQHICQIVISQSIGGGETVVLNLTKYLLKYSVITSVIINDELIPYFKDFNHLNIINIGKLYKYNFKNPFLRYLYIHLYMLYYRNKILKKILMLNIDILHIHLPMSMKIYNYLKKYLFIKTVFTIHGVSDFHHNHKLNNILFSQKKKNLKNINFYTSACEYFLSYYKHLQILDSKKNNYILIENGIELNNYNSVKNINLDGDFKLLFVGGTRYEKGGDVLVKSLKKINKHIPNFKLYILRDIPNDHFIKMYVTNNNLDSNVVFLGYVRPPKYYEYMKNIDVLVLTSRTEGIAISILEALTFGKPIVSTRVGGIPEIIKHGQNGLLTSLNPESVSDAIIELYENKTLYSKISTNNKLYAKLFSWDNIIKKYIKLYFKIYTM